MPDQNNHLFVHIGLENQPEVLSDIVKAEELLRELKAVIRRLESGCELHISEAPSETAANSSDGENKKNSIRGLTVTIGGCTTEQQQK